MTMQLNDLTEDMSLASAPVGYVSVPARPGIYRNGLKRAFDIAFVLATAFATLPIILVLATLVALDGKSPFFRNERVGRNGRVFQMLKLRTMVPNAEGMLAVYLSKNPQAQSEWDATQKLKRDPRITSLGRFLRKTSLDELPQIWNVLRGDMSVVGPRPMMPNQRVLYNGLAYYALRPGITGLWQVSKRNECKFSARVDFDRDYDRMLSFPVDLWIIVSTFRAIMRGTGY
jgi:lipopolysaccharide/colanic/teichoic acid biosynthesis glycosyltransferase